jgi:uncharacterized protein (DUF1800 family)
MSSHRLKFAVCFLSLALAFAAPQVLAKKKEKRTEAGTNEQKRAMHALNRLGFGPRPGDVQSVMAMGVDQWIDLQLHPEKIDDKALDARLAPFRTLHMDAHQLVQDFPDPQMIKAVMNGKRAMPSDPAKRAIYQAQIARYEDKQAAKDSATGGAANANGASSNYKPASVTTIPAMNSAEMNSANDAAAPGVLMSDGSYASASASDESKVPAPQSDAKPAPVDDAQARRREDRLYANLEVQQLLDLPPDQRMKRVLNMKPEEQQAFADSVKGDKGQEFFAGMDAKQKETFMALNNPQMVVGMELMQAKLLRAIYSERQLEEVMTDFWFNHFNVFIGKGADHYLITGYERDAIRPHALGKFEDLLVATAKSPAMLFYLDNWLSVGPDSPSALGLPANGRRYPPRFPAPNAGKSKGKRSSGLNENYGRELMELHTLSVNGGYTQQDVTEVAKVFTGWTIEKPQEGGGFKYDPRMHEPGNKMVLGHRIKGKGEGEGYEVLRMLAQSPQTAHFICLKLAQRFVADDPPPTLVDGMAKTYLKKKGDIREVLATLFHSPEFWSEAAYRAKVKTPLEFLASALRVTGADVTDAMPLAKQLNNMGMPLYSAQPPTGYSMKAETWVNSSALLGRMNFALSLTGGKVKGVTVDQARWTNNAPAPADSAQALGELENGLLGGEVSKQTHDSIAARFDDPRVSQRKLDDPNRPPDVAAVAGLLLGSPEFQRR